MSTIIFKFFQIFLQLDPSVTNRVNLLFILYIARHVPRHIPPPFCCVTMSPVKVPPDPAPLFALAILALHRAEAHFLQEGKHEIGFTL